VVYAQLQGVEVLHTWVRDHSWVEGGRDYTRTGSVVGSKGPAQGRPVVGMEGSKVLAEVGSTAQAEVGNMAQVAVDSMARGLALDTEGNTIALGMAGKLAQGEDHELARAGVEEGGPHKDRKAVQDRVLGIAEGKAGRQAGGIQARDRAEGKVRGMVGG